LRLTFAVFAYFHFFLRRFRLFLVKGSQLFYFCIVDFWSDVNVGEWQSCALSASVDLMGKFSLRCWDDCRVMIHQILSWGKIRAKLATLAYYNISLKSNLFKRGFDDHLVWLSKVKLRHTPSSGFIVSFPLILDSLGCFWIVRVLFQFMGFPYLVWLIFFSFLF
jgi:hypothetical protein